MAELTNVTYLMRKAKGESEFTKLIDIVTYPQLGGTPETVDITTLSDRYRRRNMLGLQAAESLEFTAHYSKPDYEKLNNIMVADRSIINNADLATYRIYFNDGGSNGIFEWQGKLSVYAAGGDVGAVREISFSISDEGETELHYVAEAITPSITLDKTSISIAEGASETITATVVPSTATVSWESSDTATATVANGVVTGVAAGSATITASFTYDGQTYSKTCSVTVTA